MFRSASQFCVFQSTPPVKAATNAALSASMGIGISIHAAREGGDNHDRLHAGGGKISIHAAREGGDLCAGNCRGNAAISIHAAREGGDGSGSARAAARSDFNPRRP